MLIIADPSRPLAIAGIMGGLDSEIGSGALDVLLEPADRRRVRALRVQLTPAQLLEAIGVAALGNGLCRLGPMVDQP